MVPLPLRANQGGRICWNPGPGDQLEPGGAAGTRAAGRIENGGGLVAVEKKHHKCPYFDAIGHGGIITHKSGEMPVKRKFGGKTGTVPDFLRDGSQRVAGVFPSPEGGRFLEPTRAEPVGSAGTNQGAQLRTGGELREWGPVLPGTHRRKLFHFRPD